VTSEVRTIWFRSGLVAAAVAVPVSGAATTTPVMASAARLVISI
jgi:hypothetical protein